ncbi:hypothetical protein [Actinoplanes cyaneus]|nr:hypothetical protein [Actinoplanes cyaneus]
MSNGIPGFPPAPANPEMTQPLRTAAGNPDMTMPLTSAAMNGDFDRTTPLNLAGGNADLTMPVNLAAPGTSDMTLPVNLAAATNIDATMPVNYIPTQHSPASAQRNAGGQVYSSTGGHPAIDMTMPVGDPVENSGSLTGHILAQGWHDAKVDQRRGNLKVVIAMLIVLGLLVAVSLVFVLTVGSSFTDLLKGTAG